MKRSLLWTALLFAWTQVCPPMILGASPDQPPTPPATRVAPVIDTLHGVPVVDPYRWLEDSLSPEVSAWAKAQYDYFKSWVDSYPGKEKVRADLMKVLEAGSVGTPYVYRNRYFQSRRTGKQNQPILYTRVGLEGKDEVLIDPNTLSADGTAALDWYFPSIDGGLVAYGISVSGSENSTLYVLRSDSKAHLSDTIPDTRATSLTWLPDASGFYYTRYPARGSVPTGDEQYYRRAYFHKLGTPWASDPMIFEDTTDKTAWVDVSLSEDGKRLFLYSSKGWSQTKVFYRDLTIANSPIIPLVTDHEATYGITPLPDRFVVSTTDGASRGHVLVGRYDRPQFENWKEIIQEREVAIQSVQVINNQLVVVSMKNAVSQIERFDLDGKLLGSISTPTLGSVGAPSGEIEGKELFFSFNSFTYPVTIFRYDFATNEQKVIDKVTIDLDLANLDVSQVWYESKDGTPISMFIVAPKGLTLDGSHPTLLDGYGGFNASTTPFFSKKVSVWLAHGGVYATPNLRGGGEYGEAWHRGGMLENKQNTFDDFAAAAEYLIAEKYTNPARLALYGGSNGGLLIGAMVTQHPDLFAAAVCDVPLLDMIRYHLFRIARLWVPEYGSSEDSTQFGYILKYSPYQNVKKGTPYPSVLHLCGESDGRVDPLHARKMTALLQASTSSDNRIFLRQEAKAGHGQGKPVAKVADELTDELCYLFKSLQIKF